MIREHINLFLKTRISRKSKSPRASNVVIVRKKDNTFCVDFRQLNKKTKKDAYALPRIEEMLDGMAGNRYIFL